MSGLSALTMVQVVVNMVLCVLLVRQIRALKRSRETLEEMMKPPTCAICDSPTRVHINGIATCHEHAEDVLRLAVNMEAIENGADPEMAERMVADLLDDLRRRVIMGDDD